MPDASYGSLSFAEQIAFFRRKLNLPTRAWTDIWNEAHDHAFVVAGANRDDLLADLRDAIDKAIANGTTLEQFRKDFDAIVAKYGWDYNGGRNWRSRVIYETNLRSSYAAGRYAQLQAVKKARPYWRYRHSDAVKHPRPLHLAWNGLVLDADDPWWDTHFPPNGWGCQCTVEALNDRDLGRLGKDGPDQAPDDGSREVTVGARGPTPRTVDVPNGVDPGFGYAPGKDAFEQLVQQALDKTVRLPADEAAFSADQILSLPRSLDALERGFADFLDGIDPAATTNSTYNVGALTSDLVAALKDQGIEPSTAAILARDVELVHALREAKSKAFTAGGLPKALSPDELAQLPVILGNPQAVLLDVNRQTLLYVFSAERREAGKIVVRVNYRLKTDAGKQITNMFTTGSLIDLEDVNKELRSGALVLLVGEM